MYNEPENCLVSIQWGKGPHYFVGHGPVEKTTALLQAQGHIDRLKTQLPRRGALPTVRVLEVCIEVPIKREPQEKSNG